MELQQADSMRLYKKYPLSQYQEKSEEKYACKKRGIRSSSQ
jgi:hypothetical protein